MNAKALHKLTWRLMKLRTALEKARAKDPGLESLFDQAHKLWIDSYRLASARELEEARRKDGTETLWTLFLPPRHYGWDINRTIIRTPHRRIETLTLSNTPVEHVVSPDRAYEDLQKSWPEVDLAAMTARAAMVDSKPKHFWSEAE